MNGWNNINCTLAISVFMVGFALIFAILEVLEANSIIRIVVLVFIFFMFMPVIVS